jgi:prefoldin subunit 5
MTKEQDKKTLYEMVGAVKAMKMIGSFVDAGRYSLYRQIRASKAYTLLGMDWKEFCIEGFGHDQKTINAEIKLLEEFGEPFIRAAESIRLSKRELNALGSGLSEDAKAEIKKGVITIGDSVFKVSELGDNMDEFKGLLDEYTRELHEARASLKAERRVGENNHKAMDTLNRRLDSLTKKKKTMASGEEDFLKEMANLRTGFDGYMLRVDLNQMEELTASEAPTPRMRAAYIETLGYMVKQLLAAQATAIQTLGDPAMCPDEGWAG